MTFSAGVLMPQRFAVFASLCQERFAVFAIAFFAKAKDRRAMYLEAIRSALAKPGKSRGGLAAAMDVHQSQVTRLLNGTRSLKAEEIPLVAQYLGIPESAFAPSLKAEDDVFASAAPVLAERAANTIPEIDIRAGASYSGGVDDESWNVPIAPGEAISGHRAVASWGLPAAFVERELGLSFGHADIIQVRGDSMDDGTVHSLVSGDRVIVDRRDIDPRQGGVFAVWDGDGVIIKQVELIRGHEPPRVICKSLNRRYDPIELVLDGNAHIIGRVAGKISRV